jgi:hypothetical protein
VETTEVVTNDDLKAPKKVNKETTKVSKAAINDVSNKRESTPYMSSSNNDGIGQKVKSFRQVEAKAS